MLVAFVDVPLDNDVQLQHCNCLTSRGPATLPVMPASSPALIALLRRHLRVVALLFVCLVMLKTGFAVACAADSLAGPPDTAAAVAVGDSSSEALSATSSEPSDDCWHSASGGCHCSCAHVTPLLSGSHVVNALAVAPVQFAAAPHAVCLAPRDDALRPPIV